MLHETVYEYGMGFGTMKLDSTTQTVFDSNEIKSSSVLQDILTPIVGTNPNGTPKKFDLNNYIKLPEFIVKADNTQWWYILLIIIISLLGINLLRKKNKK